MKSSEVNVNYSKRKVEVMPRLCALSIDDQKTLIVAASKYMGNFTKAGLVTLLGGRYGENNVRELIQKASYIKIGQALEYMWSYIDYMQQRCPCCRQIVEKTR